VSLKLVSVNFNPSLPGVPVLDSRDSIAAKPSGRTLKLPAREVGGSRRQMPDQKNCSSVGVMLARKRS